jgi:hypothetical protein
MMTLIQDSHTNKFRMSLIDDSEFISAIEGLQSFVLDNNADCDMAYDWVCDQCNIHSFAGDKPAWDLFYQTFTSAQD